MKKNNPAPAKKTSAATLIAEVERRSKIPPPSERVLDELRELLRYNDEQPIRMRHVSAERAISHLQTHGWAGRTREAINKVCRQELGRKSYAEAK